jgi:hypothetical protein
MSRRVVAVGKKVIFALGILLSVALVTESSGCDIDRILDIDYSHATMHHGR